MLDLHSGPPVFLTAPGGTAGITVETLQMQKKKNRLMEEAKKNGRTFTRWRALCWRVKVCSPVWNVFPRSAETFRNKTCRIINTMFNRIVEVDVMFRHQKWHHRRRYSLCVGVELMISGLLKLVTLAALITYLSADDKNRFNHSCCVGV